MTNTMVTTTTTTTTPPPPAKPITNQSDGNDKRDTITHSTSTNYNSSHSKIPVLNSSTRSMKCASWAGNDLPLTPTPTTVTDLNDLTPGNRHALLIWYY